MIVEVLTGRLRLGAMGMAGKDTSLGRRLVQMVGYVGVFLAWAFPGEP